MKRHKLHVDAKVLLFYIAPEYSILPSDCHEMVEVIVTVNNI